MTVETIAFTFRYLLPVLPNMRLKLSAPVPNRSSGLLERRCASIPFVNTFSVRRSLSAIR